MAGVMKKDEAASKFLIDQLDDRLHSGSTRSGRRLSEEAIVEEDEEDGDGDSAVAAKTSTGGGSFVHKKTHRSGSLGEGNAGSAAGVIVARKGKRTPRDRAYSTSEDGRFGTCATSSVAPHVSHGRHGNKNCRKSRNSLGRGLPKKGGAGGKGTWGKLGCELELPWVDRKDPNYESDDDMRDTGRSSHTTMQAILPEMSEEDIVKTVQPLFLEYFENNDATEVVCSLQEILMNLGGKRWIVVFTLIEMALDHKPSHREMTSVLISEMYLKIISQRDIGKAFDQLFRQLPDLILDTPDAPEVVGNFLARAIADDCVPPKFLHSYKGHAESPEAKSALRRADTLLSMKHGLVRLDDVWGVGGGVRPVKYLIKKIVLLLKEYLCSGDVQEATKCLLELEVPHFHHELVYEAVVMVIESMHEQTDEAICKLLRYLFRSFVITINQMKMGFEHVYDNMPDIALDVPKAYSLLERFVLRCRKDGIITDELVRKMPSRGRKRFVSEGDGGALKNW